MSGIHTRFPCSAEQEYVSGPKDRVAYLPQKLRMKLSGGHCSAGTAEQKGMPFWPLLRKSRAKACRADVRAGRAPLRALRGYYSAAFPHMQAVFAISTAFLPEKEVFPRKGRDLGTLRAAKSGVRARELYHTRPFWRQPANANQLGPPSVFPGRRALLYLRFSRAFHRPSP